VGSEMSESARYAPQVQVVVAGQVVVQLDAVLEGLHGGVSETQRRVILLAKVSGLVAGWLQIYLHYIPS
jgi:hypothetical protein